MGEKLFCWVKFSVWYFVYVYIYIYIYIHTYIPTYIHTDTIQIAFIVKYLLQV